MDRPLRKRRFKKSHRVPPFMFEKLRTGSKINYDTRLIPPVFLKNNFSENFNIQTFLVKEFLPMMKLPSDHFHLWQISHFSEHGVNTI